MGHVRHVIRSLWNILGNNAAHLLRLEDRSRCQIIEGEFRLGTSGARHACSRLRGLTIPKNAVAGRMRHRPTTSKLIEQTACSRSLPELHRRLFVFKELDAGATGLREGLEKV